MTEELIRLRCRDCGTEYDAPDLRSDSCPYLFEDCPNSACHSGNVELLVYNLSEVYEEMKQKWTGLGQTPDLPSS